MRTVWKYPMRDDRLTVGLREPKVVHVACQDGVVTVWVEHEGVLAWETLELAIVGTGHPVPDEFAHAGSTLDPPFVWHVYARYLS